MEEGRKFRLLLEIHRLALLYPAVLALPELVDLVEQGIPCSDLYSVSAI